MANKSAKVGYRLVRNGTSTADRAPYLGVAVPVGSLAYDNILTRMLARGTYMTRATAQYFLNAFYEFAAEVIADDVVRINMGAVSSSAVRTSRKPPSSPSGTSNSPKRYRAAV